MSHQCLTTVKVLPPVLTIITNFVGPLLILAAKWTLINNGGQPTTQEGWGGCQKSPSKILDGMVLSFFVMIVQRQWQGLKNLGTINKITCHTEMERKFATKENLE